MVRNELLSRSFMLMSFAAAAFLVVTQWQTEPDVAAESVAAATVVAPVEQGAYEPQSVEQSTTQSATQSATEPVTEIRSSSVTSTISDASLADSQPRLKSGLATTLPTFLAADLTRLVVDLSDRKVYFYQGDQVQATYPIGIGQPGWETPTGSFQIDHMQPDPIWQHPITGQTIPAGPNNPLGSRWIGFWESRNYEIGFHGTNQPNSVGKAVSHGCLRMHEADIRVLYDHVKLGTPVIVQQ